MKSLFLALTMFVGLSAFARGGGQGNNLPLNTNAYLIHEATESSFRMLLLSDATAANQVTAMSAAMIDGLGTTTVIIELGPNRTAKYVCKPFDELSHGGTIVKKEMICQLN